MTRRISELPSRYTGKMMILALLSLAATEAVKAQTVSTAQINGNVKDESGAVFAGS